jgi:hypothetical protein
MKKQNKHYKNPVVFAFINTHNRTNKSPMVLRMSNNEDPMTRQQINP